MTITDERRIQNIVAELMIDKPHYDRAEIERIARRIVTGRNEMSELNTDERLTEILRIAQAATPGPWELDSVLIYRYCREPTSRQSPAFVGPARGLHTGPGNVNVRYERHANRRRRGNENEQEAQQGHQKSRSLRGVDNAAHRPGWWITGAWVRNGGIMAIGTATVHISADWESARTAFQHAEIAAARFNRMVYRAVARRRGIWLYDRSLRRGYAVIGR